MLRRMSSRSNGDSCETSNVSDVELQKIFSKRPTSSSSSTIYNRLEDSDEIRLLYLHPYSHGQNDIITCSIKHVKLFEVPKYEALSYMWGPKGEFKSISVEANTCFVMENLWSALSHLRLKDEVRVLWIDAICINQDDVVERNHQVTQMGGIYGNATRALVWLGKSNQESSLAFSVLSKTGEDSDWASYSDTSILCPPASEKGTLKLKAIQSICYRQYWTRLWIIQEILMATDISLCCGDETLPWGCLASFFTHLTKPFSSNLDTTGLTQVSERVIRAIDDSIPARLFREASKRRHLKSWNQQTHRSLFDLCVEYGDAECEDRRDKIFGLHAFARDCCRRAAPIDYSLSWYETYSMVLIHYILQHANRKFLGDDVLYILQVFHQKIGMTSREPLWAMPSRPRLEELARNHMDLILNATPIKFRGNVRGRVKHVVPLWSMGQELPDGSKFPPFLQVYISQLHFIENLHTYQPNQKHRVNSQIDLVWSANQALSRVTCPVKPSFPNYIGRTDPQTGNKHIFQFQKDNITTLNVNIIAILDDAKAVLQDKRLTDMVLAFEENGLICFAPKETKIGDLICQFLSSDVLAVVRPSWRGYTMVGRAVSFLASEPNVPFQALPIRRYMSKDFDVKLCEVLFDLDILGLQMMTRASVCPSPEVIHENEYESTS